MSTYRDWDRSAPLYQPRRVAATTPTEKWLKRFREGFAILPPPLLDGFPSDIDNLSADVSIVESSLQECLEDSEWTSYNVYGLLGAVSALQYSHDKKWELSKKKLDLLEKMFKSTTASYGEAGALLRTHTSLFQILVYIKMIVK